MSGLQVLLVTDAPEMAADLARLIDAAGGTPIAAQESAPPPPCDIVVIDLTRTRFSPFAGLQAQRRMGCNAPAILFAPRLTDQMATELFDLNIRDFVLRPVEDEEAIRRISSFAQGIQQERQHVASSQSLQQAEMLLSRRIEELAALSRIGRAIASLSDVDQILSHIVDAGVYLAHAEEGAMFLVDKASGQLLLRAEKGLGARQAEAIRRPSTDSDAMEVLRTGKPILRSGDSEHKVKTGFLVRSLVNVPVIIGQQVVGVLAVYHHGARSFEAGDQAILSNLADYAAIALERLRLLDSARAELDQALKASREVGRHAATLTAPIEGMESLINTLLDGSLGPLNEAQRTTISRIRQAAERLKEIRELIDHALAADSTPSPQV